MTTATHPNIDVQRTTLLSKRELLAEEWRGLALAAASGDQAARDRATAITTEIAALTRDIELLSAAGTEVARQTAQEAQKQAEEAHTALVARRAALQAKRRGLYRDIQREAGDLVAVVQRVLTVGAELAATQSALGVPRGAGLDEHGATVQIVAEYLVGQLVRAGLGAAIPLPTSGAGRLVEQVAERQR